MRYTKYVDGHCPKTGDMQEIEVTYHAVRSIGFVGTSYKRMFRDCDCPDSVKDLCEYLVHGNAFCPILNTAPESP